jgi:hypothetical protein
MLLNEMFDENPVGYSTEKDDNSVIKLNDLRKTRLTLSRIRKLRILNDIRKLELAKKRKRLATQYGVQQGGEGMGGLGI